MNIHKENLSGCPPQIASCFNRKEMQPETSPAPVPHLPMESISGGRGISTSETSLTKERVAFNRPEPIMIFETGSASLILLQPLTGLTSDELRIVQQHQCC